MMASHARHDRSRAAEGHWRLRCQAAALDQWRATLQEGSQPYVEHAERACKARVLSAWRAQAEAAREAHSRRAELLQQAVSHMQRRCAGSLQRA